jgi:DnaJ-class molecular chaperone
MAKSAEKQERVCPDCGGAGEVPGRYTGPETVQCGTCKGSGTVKAAEPVAAVDEQPEQSVAAEEPAGA